MKVSDCQRCGEPLSRPYTSCSCGWRAPGSIKQAPPGRPKFMVDLNTPVGGRDSPENIVDKQCAFDEYGQRCEMFGTCTDSTRGYGPWYCSEHYWKLQHGWRDTPKMPPEQHAEWMDDIRTLVASKTGRNTSAAQAPAAPTESATVSGQWEGRPAAPGPTGERVDEDTGEITAAPVAADAQRRSDDHDEVPHPDAPAMDERYLDQQQSSAAQGSDDIEPF